MKGLLRFLPILITGSALSGCGFTVRAGVAPVIDTRGDVRADLIFSVGLGFPTGRTGGTPEAAMSVRLPVLSADGRAESGAFSLGGLLRADYGPDGRLGLALERARLTNSSGEDRTLTGVGVRVGVLAPLRSWDWTPTTGYNLYRRNVSLQAGAELQLRYLWGGPDGRGELALPLTLEYWHL